MKITATSKVGSALELSSLNRLEDMNSLEGQPFQILLRAHQSVIVDDKWYNLISIQNALKGGYIEITDYYKQRAHSSEISSPMTLTPNFGLYKVEILNRSEYPQEPFAQFNANMDVIDANMGSGGGGGSNAVWGHITGVIGSQSDLQLSLQSKANVSGQVFSGAISATNLSGDNTGDQDLSGYLTKSNASSEYITISNASSTYLTDAPSNGSQYARQNNAWAVITGGSSSHSALINLDYESSGHIGFLSNSNAASTYETIANVFAHASNASIHFLTTEIDHTLIQNIGTNSHAQIDIDLSRLANTSGNNTGDQSLSGYLTISNASAIYLTQVNASSVYLTDAPSDGSQYARQNNAWSVVAVGSSSHSALINLDYESSGHTGFLSNSNAASTYETISNVFAHASNSAIHFIESSIDHINIQNIGTNSHAQIDIDLSRLANTSGNNTGDQSLSGYLTESNASSTYLTESNAVSTYETIANVFAHTSNSSIHFLTSEIDHITIQNIGTNSHVQIDIDLSRLANTSGNNTGDQDLSAYLKESNASSVYITASNAASTYETISNVFSHTSNSSVHFLTTEIDHTVIQNIGTNSHAQIDIDLARLANTSGNNTGDQSLSGYLTEANASSVYLTISNASSTYLTEETDPIFSVHPANSITEAYLMNLANVSGINAGDQVGDGVTITGAGTIGDPFVSSGGDLSGYLTIANAASTYLTDAPSNGNAYSRQDGGWVVASGGAQTTITGITVQDYVPLTTGAQGYYTVPYSGTITGWTLTADVAGSIVFDIWKKAGAIPTVTDTITASAKPSLSSAQLGSSNTLTGWTTTLLEGDVLGYNIDSCSVITQVTLTIKVTK